MNWKNIKSLFVVDDGKKTEQKAPVTPPKQNTSNNKGNTIIRDNKEEVPIKIETPTTSDNKSLVEKGEVKESFVNHLLKALEQNDIEGIDYLEFKKTLQSFAKMPMDKDLRFQSALTAVKSMGASDAKIIESAKFYLEILAKEEKNFLEAVERNRKNQVEGQLQRMDQLKKMKAEKETLIQKMQTEMEQITKEVAGIQSKVQNAQVSIDSKRNHFYASYEHVSNQIKRDLAELTKVRGNENKPEEPKQ
ncbi:MAG: hypothetical protein ACPG5P_05010 [Saprospiraceae bacterium]